MVDFNPILFLRRTWDDTTSIWGKTCVILLYVYIWLQAMWSLEGMIAGKAGWECYFQGLSDYATELVVMFIRAMCVMELGFWMYAHRGGIQVWNVGMVFVFNAALARTWITSNIMDLEGAPVCGKDRAVVNITWAFFWWTLVTLICALMEHGSKPQRTTTSETNPILN